MDNKIFGAAGEKVAADFLRAQGIIVRARNFHTRTGEIDIIGEYNGMILFVEVKTRRDKIFGRAGEAVDTRKQKKIVRAAMEYLARNNLKNCPCRFDVLEVYCETDGTWRVVPILGAFEADF